LSGALIVVPDDVFSNPKLSHRLLQFQDFDVVLSFPRPATAMITSEVVVVQISGFVGNPRTGQQTMACSLAVDSITR
jgi:hypothetical protein